MSNALFGPGGNSESFYADGLKSTLDAPAWLVRKGLDAYEYQPGNGLTASDATLAKIGEAAMAHSIKMSLHTPYYISLSGVEPEKRLKSIDYIKKKSPRRHPSRRGYDRYSQRKRGEDNESRGNGARARHA